jgi:PmbA protein
VGSCDGRGAVSELLEVAESALTLAGVDGVEVALTRSTSALTRYADSRIHQNTARSDGEARVRVVVDGARVGVVATTSLTPEGVRRAAEAAREAARLTPPDPHFGGLAPAVPLGDYGEAGRDDGATAAASPAERGELVAAVLAELGRVATGAGAVETARVERAVATSTGVRVAHAATQAAVSVLASGEDSTGHAESSASALGELDAGALGARARHKVELGARPREVPVGEYAVVLEPGATVVMAQWLAWTCFPGRAVAEGRSPFSGRLGEQVCSPLVTVVDDALSPLLPGVPFDAEGTPKRRLPLLDRGVAAGVTHDRRSARESGAGTTGHALPAPNPQGGIATHVLMEPGTASLDDLVAGCERGLYVTRFHYTNLVHPVSSTITGMTRDGTFLVEDGRVVGGVRNLRFTQSILGALGGVEAVGADSEVASDLFFGAARAPALRLSSFTFTSQSGH